MFLLGYNLALSEPADAPGPGRSLILLPISPYISLIPVSPVISGRSASPLLVYLSGRRPKQPLSLLTRPPLLCWLLRQVAKQPLRLGYLVLESLAAR